MLFVFFIIYLICKCYIYFNIVKKNNYMNKCLMVKVNNVFMFLCYLVVVYCKVKIFIVK